jgi:uncharacterized protein YbaR (Trm112 family)
MDGSHRRPSLDGNRQAVPDLGGDVAIDADILAILACPSDDHAPLREETRDGADVLVCSFCATTYPVRDGIPVLLKDDATPGPNGIGVSPDVAAGSSE